MVIDQDLTKKTEDVNGIYPIYTPLIKRGLLENPSIDLGDFPAMSDCHAKGIKGRQRQRQGISERDMLLEGMNKYYLAKAKISLSEKTVIIPKSIWHWCSLLNLS